MDLGIAGRKAIVCASSKGLGRACARALAEAGCTVVLNGRDTEVLDRTARELRQATGVANSRSSGRSRRSSDARGADRRLPGRGHSRQQQRRAAVQEFRRDQPRGYPQGRRVQHADPDRAGAGAGAGHDRAQVWPHHQHHLGFGPDADRRPRRVVGRARRADRVPRFRGAAVRARQRDDQLDPAWIV